MMAGTTLEERVTALEAKLERMARERVDETGGSLPWWRQIWGDFKDDPAYAEAMRLGREYRESQPLPDEEA